MVSIRVDSEIGPQFSSNIERVEVLLKFSKKGSNLRDYGTGMSVYRYPLSRLEEGTGLRTEWECLLDRVPISGEVDEAAT
jgi:hypothetical protein